MSQQKKRRSWLLILLPVLAVVALATGYWFLLQSGSVSLPGLAADSGDAVSLTPKEELLELRRQNQQLEEQLAQSEKENQMLRTEAEKAQQMLLAQTDQQNSQKERLAKQQPFDQLEASAKIFADMPGSKSVAILQNMQPIDALLILKAMDEKEKGRVLSKLDPELASQYAVYIQHTPELSPGNYEEVKMQLELLLQQPPITAEPKQYTSEDVIRIFDLMEPEQSADVLAIWWETDTEAALNMFRSMDHSQSAQILSGMDTAMAAEISQNLMPDETE